MFQYFVLNIFKQDVYIFVPRCLRNRMNSNLKTFLLFATTDFILSFTILNPIKKLPAYYENQSFITVFTIAHNWSLS